VHEWLHGPWLRQVDVIALKTGPFGWTGVQPDGERLGAPMRDIIGTDPTFEGDGDGNEGQGTLSRVQLHYRSSTLYHIH
jgi:hypothetical protein